MAVLSRECNQRIVEFKQGLIWSKRPIVLCNVHTRLVDFTSRTQVFSNQLKVLICLCFKPVKVFLTDVKTSFKRLFERRRSFLADKRGIFYKHKEIQTNTKKLLQHHCQFCPDRPPERCFDRLRDHIKKEHSKFFCDICVAHLQKFSWEFKVYTRPDLARHRRIGDEDDKSHKGHPRCEFCDERFLDNDELHIHLRKNHFWCHICERDGSQDYYANYLNLREHFRDFHFLCEEGDCIHEKFTSVFRSKVDLQAHRVGKHATSLTKAQARQARQLDVDISFAPHPRFQGNQRSVITGHDFAEVKTNEEKKGKKEKSGNRGGASIQNRYHIYSCISRTRV